MDAEPAIPGGQTPRECRGHLSEGHSLPSDHPSSIDSLEGRWWLVHTKPRNEKAIAVDLAARGIGFFLPLARLHRRYGGRTTQVQIPLFPGYLFLCGGEDERYATLMTHRAVNVIYAADQVGLKAELRQLGTGGSIPGHTKRPSVSGNRRRPQGAGRRGP